MTDSEERGQVEAVSAAMDTNFRVIPGQGQGSPNFDAVFTQHYAFVRRALAGMGAPSASVDDLAQDVFIVVHRRFSEYDSAREVRSWLWGIARRVLQTHGRTAARAQRKLRALPTPEPDRSPDERLDLQRKADLVGEILAGMSEEQREVFMLIEIEGLTAPQVAAATGNRLNTVYSRLRGARERFAKAVSRHRVTLRRQGRG